jgi:hypothetical protein
VVQPVNLGDRCYVRVSRFLADSAARPGNSAPFWIRSYSVHLNLQAAIAPRSPSSSWTFHIAQSDSQIQERFRALEDSRFMSTC